LAAGVGTASGVGLRFNASVGQAAGIGGAAAISLSFAAATGRAAGVGAALGQLIEIGIIMVTGSASGAGDALGRSGFVQPDIKYDYPIGKSLESDYGIRKDSLRRGGRLVIGRK
jgi:hypothetical protein